MPGLTVYYVWPAGLLATYAPPTLLKNLLHRRAPPWPLPLPSLPPHPHGHITSLPPSPSYNDQRYSKVTLTRPAPHSAPSKNLSLLYIWQLCHSFEQHITLSLLRAGSELQLPLLIFPGLSSPLLPSAPRSPQSLITIHRSRRKGAEEGFPCTLVPTSHTSYETPRLLPSWYVLVAVLKTTPQRHTRRSSSVPSQAKLPPSLAPHLPAWAAAAKAETAAAAAARRAFGRRLVTSATSRPSPSFRSCSAPPPSPVEAPTTPASASSASTSRTHHRRETLIKMPRPLLLLPPPLPPRRAAAAAGPPPTAAAAAAASAACRAGARRAGARDDA